MKTPSLHNVSTRSALRIAKSGLRPFHRFHETLFRYPEIAQRRIRNRIVRRLAQTEYGAHLKVRGPQDFERIPVVDYEDIDVWLTRQRRSGGPVLTPDPILFYEKTSGSSADAKYIPYTAALRSSFTRMFLLWVADILLYGKRSLSTGKTYISISPSFSHEAANAHDVPVGMKDDSEYLSSALQPLMRLFLVCNSEIADAANVDTFRRATCRALVLNSGLEVISVWNPTFLSVLLQEIEENRVDYRRLLLGQGDFRRAELLMRSPLPWEALWPELRLISCWDAASARFPATRLAQAFPNTWMQGKGLLSTEAPISIPWLQADAQLPLLSEIWLELECENGALIAIEEAREGHEYGVVVSQLGGLYRYRLGDRVRVGPRYANTPSLVFVGRESATSDLVGEKLHEAFVERALLPLFGERSFFMLVPLPGKEPHYALIVDPAEGSMQQRFPAAEEMLAKVDRALSSSFHYGHARALGQLYPPRLCIWPAAARDTHHLFGERLRRLGDLKPSVLWTKTLTETQQNEIRKRTKSFDDTNGCKTSGDRREHAAWA